MKIDVEVHDELVSEIKESMNYWGGFDLTTEQIVEYLKIYSTHFGFDTVERENFLDFLGKKIVGMAWPLNGDSKEYSDKFFDKLKREAKNKGYNYEE